jgi:hypothetical protein
MSYPRFNLSRSFKMYRASSGTLAVGTSWALIDNAYSLSLLAQVGDVIEMVFEGNIVPNAAASIMMDYEIGGVRQGDSTNGSWQTTLNSGWWGPINPRFFHSVVSGDISAGLITIKPWGKGQSAQNFITTPRPLLVVRNLGPVDPN